MKIAVTGNQKGLDAGQKKWLRDYLEANATDIYVMYHGDCVGVDAEAHDLVREVVPACKIVIHPPIETCEMHRKLRANKKGDDVRPAKPHLVRNRKIVKKSRVVLGFPRGPETTRSGTWATLREAAARNKERYVVYPMDTDGNCKVEHVAKGKQPSIARFARRRAHTRPPK